MDTEKERQMILAKHLGKKLACMVIGSVRVEFVESAEMFDTVITIKNEITSTTFVYKDNNLYYNYYIVMKTIEEIIIPIMVQYRKYVNAMFYKRTETDKNTIKKWIHDNHNLD